MVRRILERMVLEEDLEDASIELNERRSNTLAIVHFRGGRKLIVKRARFDWLAGRFHTSVAASRLVHDRTDLLAPRYLGIPEDREPAGGRDFESTRSPEAAGSPELDGAPTLVYWWISSPTLGDVWERLGPDARERAMRETGSLLRRIHDVHPPGHGPLLESLDGGQSLIEFLEWDLMERLSPAIEACWPGEEESAIRLLSGFEARLAERPEPAPVLVHNDLFVANILCDERPDGIHCVGVLDFEDAFAGPPEADLAKTEVLHGPLFRREIPGRWFEGLLEGYGESPDPQLIALFRAYHLLNMGFHAAATGLTSHANDLAVAIGREIDAWRWGLRHREVLA